MRTHMAFTLYSPPAGGGARVMICTHKHWSGDVASAACICTAEAMLGARREVPGVRAGLRRLRLALGLEVRGGRGGVPLSVGCAPHVDAALTPTRPHTWPACGSRGQRSGTPSLPICRHVCMVLCCA